MHKIALVLSAGCLLVVTRGHCETPKPKAASQVPASRYNEAGPATFDVCSLLKPAEIQKINGSSITESKRSGHSDGSLRISQCIYLARKPNESVSLVLTQSGSLAKDSDTAKGFWLERFGPFETRRPEKKEETEERKEAEEEREGRPPRKISGLGEEAFWTAGSLYVLRKEVFFRLSLGGPGAEAVKLDHAKALAAFVLKRL